MRWECGGAGDPNDPELCFVLCLAYGGNPDECQLACFEGAGEGDPCVARCVASGTDPLLCELECGGETDEAEWCYAVCLDTGNSRRFARKSASVRKLRESLYRGMRGFGTELASVRVGMRRHIRQRPWFVLRVVCRLGTGPCPVRVELSWRKPLGTRVLCGLCGFGSGPFELPTGVFWGPDRPGYLLRGVCEYGTSRPDLSVELLRANPGILLRIVPGRQEDGIQL